MKDIKLWMKNLIILFNCIMDFPDLNYLKVYDFNTQYKMRLGSKFDGGYVIGLIPGSYDCYISAGVANEESFSRDFINFFKMDKTNSFAFDGTIKQYPYNYTRNITYIKKNINNMINNSNTNLIPLINNYKNIFLKMDIEGGEYNWIKDIDEKYLDKFQQVVIEFHELGVSHFEKKIECLKKMNNNFYIIHAHANNYDRIFYDIPKTIELTFLNKKLFDKIPELNITNLPINQLDFPNCEWKKDIMLNFYPFVERNK